MSILRDECKKFAFEKVAMQSLHTTDSLPLCKKRKTTQPKMIYLVVRTNANFRLDCVCDLKTKKSKAKNKHKHEKQKVSVCRNMN